MTSSSNGIILKNMQGEASSFIFPEITHAPEIEKNEKEETEAEAEPAEAAEESARESAAAAADEERRLLLEAAQEEADEILRRARREAESMKEQLLAECEELRRTAGEDGFRKGYEDGVRTGRQDAENEAEKRLNERLAEFEQEAREAVENINRAKEESLRRYLDELLDCAIAVAEKVVCVSLHTSGEVMKRMLLSAAKNLKKSEWAKVYIDRYDYTMLLEGDADALNWLSELSDSIKFVVMDREGEGTCIIETPSEIVDISVNTQMENIREIVSGTKI